MRTLYKQKHSSKYETIKNFNEQSYRDFVDLGTLMSGFVHDIFSIF